jgi:hypothetical protein
MDPLSPQQQLAQMLVGYWMSQMLYVAAKLGLADLVKDRPRTADDLAAATQTNPRSLYRLLRALASTGVFAEDEARRFSLTPLAACLQSDAPGSQRAMAITAGELFYATWGELLYSVQTGKVGFDKVFGLPIFDYLSKNPQRARLFDETMVAVHGRETAAMLDVYDFSGIRVLADIGGGNSSVLTAVLQRHLQMRGILFDLPGVVERAKSNLQAAGLTNRCLAVNGSFFDGVPEGADAYLLRHIIHDWDDAKCTTILRNIHAVMPKDGKLLVVESVIPPGKEPCFGKLLDLAMMVIPGGEERTEEEYRKLFDGAGFRLTRIVATKAEVSVIEGKKG